MGQSPSGFLGQHPNAICSSVSFWEDWGRGGGLAGSELGPGLLSKLQPTETLPIHPCCTVKGHEGRDSPSPGPHKPGAQVVDPGQAF